MLRTLLGVCFWVGHRRAFYRRHPLSEGAIVAELCNLINANLPKDLELLCEQPYSQFVHVGDETSKFTERSRVDLCVCTLRDNARDAIKSCKMLIEVKRGSSSKASIKSDLARLAEVKRQRPNLRVVLFLVSERSRPAPYVTPKGFRSKRLYALEEDDLFVCKVLSAKKAVPALTDLDTAHYACALEVLRKKKR